MCKMRKHLFLRLFLAAMLLHTLVPNFGKASGAGNANVEVLDATVTIEQTQEMSFGSFFPPETNQAVFRVYSGNNAKVTSGTITIIDGSTRAGVVVFTGDPLQSGVGFEFSYPNGRQLVNINDNTQVMDFVLRSASNKGSTNFGTESRTGNNTFALNNKGKKTLYITGQITVPNTIKSGSYQQTVNYDVSF